MTHGERDSPLNREPADNKDEGNAKKAARLFRMRLGRSGMMKHKKAVRTG